MDFRTMPGQIPDPEEMKAIYVAGKHMQAYFRMQTLYRNRIETARLRDGSVEMLDFGTGRSGVARNISEPRLKPGDRLALYDPNASIEQPSSNRSRIVDAQEAYGRVSRPLNLVSIAFVLCTMEPEAARLELMRLREAHPEAEFIVVEYTLKGRESLAELLKANEEMRWRMSIGNPEFIRTRTRFDVEQLCGLLQSAELPCEARDVRPLDTLGIRAAVVIRPANEFLVAY